MSKVCVIFNPLEYIMIRGISKYTIETREVLVASGATVYTLVMPKCMGQMPRYTQVLLFIFYQQIVLPLYAAIKRPDVIFDAYNSYSILGALLWRYVYVIHDFIPFSNRFWWLKPGSVYQRVLHKISRLFPLLELCYINDIIAAEGLRLVPKFDGVIPNLVKPLRQAGSIDLEAHSLIQSLRSDHTGWLVVTTISGSGPNKDFDNLLKLLAGTLTKVILVAFGFESGKRVVNSEYLKVVFPGTVPSEYIGTMIAMSDLFVFHSLQEGFGRPVIEALLENAKVLSVGYIPAIQAVADLLWPLLHVYEGHGDFYVRFAAALQADRPYVSIDNLQGDEARHIVISILYG